MRIALDNLWNPFAVLFVAAFGFVPFIAHVVRCLEDGWITMLVAGIVFPPVGWVHGAGVLFGIW